MVIGACNPTKTDENDAKAGPSAARVRRVRLSTDVFRDIAQIAAHHHHEDVVDDDTCVVYDVVIACLHSTSDLCVPQLHTLLRSIRLVSHRAT